MAATILVHLTWTTWQREPLITPDTAPMLRRFFDLCTRRHGAVLCELGILPDHVHILLALPPEHSIPRLAQALKGASSRIANRDGLTGGDRPLRWANGYDVRSVSPRARAAVERYIRNQRGSLLPR